MNRYLICFLLTGVIAVSSSEPQQTSAAPGALPAALQAAERLPGSIKGKAVFEDGTPAAKLPVFLLRPKAAGSGQGGQGQQLSVEPDGAGDYERVARATTEEDGSFSFPRVPPGGYAIHIGQANRPKDGYGTTSAILDPGKDIDLGQVQVIKF